MYIITIFNFKKDEYKKRKNKSEFVSFGQTRIPTISTRIRNPDLYKLARGNLERSQEQQLQQ